MNCGKTPCTDQVTSRQMKSHLFVSVETAMHYNSVFSMSRSIVTYLRTEHLVLGLAVHTVLDMSQIKVKVWTLVISPLT